jgi:DNA-binding MarR family transcriptional regulator
MSRDLVDEISAAWRREFPGVVGVEFDVAKRVARLAGLLHSAVEAELARAGLTRAEYDILAVLRAAGEPYRLRPSTLAQRLALTSGGTSNVLRRLESVGLVEREPDPTDARSSWVRLSTPGVTTAEDAVRAASAAQAHVLREVPPSTVGAAVDALRDLLVALGDTESRPVVGPR